MKRSCSFNFRFSRRRLAAMSNVCFSVKALTFSFALFAHCSSSSDYFHLMEVDDIDIPAVRILFEHQTDTISCSLSCVLNGSNCRAFQLSANGSCYPNFGPQNPWSEQPQEKSETLWVRGGSRRSNCSASKFPLQRHRSRYRIETDLKSWQDAADACEALDSKLVEISTDGERKFVWQNVFDGGTSKVVPTGSSSDKVVNVWVGLRRVKKGNTKDLKKGWSWTRSNDPLSNTDFWKHDEPKNGGNNFFGTFMTFISRFEAKQESSKLFSVCECFMY